MMRLPCGPVPSRHDAYETVERDNSAIAVEALMTNHFMDVILFCSG